MSFSVDVLRNVRSSAVQAIAEANAQIADIDSALAVLEGTSVAVGAPHREVIHAEEAKPYDHIHWSLTEPDGVVQPLGGTTEPVLTPEQIDASGDLFPPVPVPDDELTFTAPPAPEAKTSGRRTNEEIAAEVGVNLEDVKEWKGPGRISRADMEEFKKLHAGAAIPGQQTIDDVGEPSLAEEEYNATLPVSPETIAEVKQVQEQLEAHPPSYGTADEAVVADDAETFEPPF